MDEDIYNNTKDYVKKKIAEARANGIEFNSERDSSIAAKARRYNLRSLRQLSKRDRHFRNKGVMIITLYSRIGLIQEKDTDYIWVPPFENINEDVMAVHDANSFPKEVKEAIKTLSDYTTSLCPEYYNPSKKERNNIYK